MIGRRVEVLADLDRVRVLCDGGVVADHVRVWARHQTISDPADVKAAQLLRQQRFACGNRSAGSLSGPAANPGPTRNTWRPAYNVRSPPGTRFGDHVGIVRIRLALTGVTGAHRVPPGRIEHRA